MAVGQLQDEVPRVPNEAAAGLEQPLLQARQRPTLDGTGEGESAQEIAEVVRDDAQEHYQQQAASTAASGTVLQLTRECRYQLQRRYSKGWWPRIYAPVSKKINR